MTPVLVDTSVWRRFFAGKSSVESRQSLEALLDEDGAVLVHTAVVGELVLGGLSAREESLFGRLPFAPNITDEEVLTFIKRRKLARRGIGWVDAQLLASALVATSTLWTADRKLIEVATALGIAFPGRWPP